jgi:hypothetical protein
MSGVCRTPMARIVQREYLFKRFIAAQYKLS